MVKTQLDDKALARLRSKYLIKPPQEAEKAAWLAMWDDYAEEDIPPQAVLLQTWMRLLDPQIPEVDGFFLYQRETGALIGFLHYILHPSTWRSALSCYVEDAYVLPSLRSAGALLVLHDALMQKVRAEQWEALYWMTKEDNHGARRFYERIAPATDWVRYEYPLEEV